MIRCWYTWLLILSFSGALRAGSTGTTCIKSTEGKDFWFGFMESRHHQSGHYLELTMTSTFACQFQVYLGKSTTPYLTATLQPNQPYRFQPPWTWFEPIGSETVEQKGIHVVSDQPMNIFAMNWSPSSADAAVIFPVDAIGNEYYAMCYEPNINEQNGSPGNGKNSEFLVVATEDNTVVNITPSKVTDQLKPANVPFKVTLNRGELYQVQSMNHANLAGQGDLTGSYIKSDKPVAFYSGSWSTTIPNSSISAWDHLYEQIPPVRSWGRKFVTVPLSGRSVDRFRILASVNNTSFRIGKNSPVSLNKGEFYEFELSSAQPSLVESNYPVLLAQYMVSNSVDRPAGVNQNSWDGDPLMLIVSPVDQTREAVTFVAYDSPNIKSKYFVNVVTKAESASYIQLDGQPVAFQSLPDTEYAFAQVPISKGNHNLNSSVAGKGFIAYVYGYGGVESYGYGVGFNLSIKLDLGGDIYFSRDTVLLCQGQVKILDAGSHFSKFLWSTGDTTQAIFINKSGYSKVTATTADGCVMTDSVYAYLSTPVVSLVNDTTICNPKTFLLDAGPGFSSYAWTTGETTRSITAKTTGSYGILTKNKYDCPARDSLFVTFVDKPRINLEQLDTLVCGEKATTLHITVDRGSYTLKSPDPAVAVNDLTVRVPVFNTYPFSFHVADAYTCVADTSFSVGFHKIPTVVISVDDTTCYGYNLDAKYLGDADTGKARFTWVFAKDTLADEIGRTQMQVKLGMDRNKRDLFLNVEEKGCGNSFVIREISVIPDLAFTVSDTLLCQPEKFAFSASNTENVLDYFWEWGDGTSEHNGRDASHIYSREGKYTVQLTATTDKNCINSIRKEDILYVAPIPTVEFSIRDNTCLGTGQQSLLYTGSGDNRDHYNWDLASLLPSELITHPGDTRGPVVFDLVEKPETTVRLQVTSKYGCVSVNRELLLKRIPEFSMELPDSSGCIPFEISLRAKTADDVDDVDYSWNFGDGGTGSGTTVRHTYPDPDKKHSITLFAASKTTGCRDTLFKPSLVTVFPEPKASFSISSKILNNENPEALFTNLSEGADHYIWDFGDGKISREKDPAHLYDVVGPRRVVLESFNSYACSDTISDQVLIALSKIFTPNAFSPNAPDPVDRQFFPWCNGVVEKGYHLKIISRWNDLVFETKDLLKGWNGRIPDGRPAPTGNYVWILTFVDFMGEKHAQQGTVTLIY